ncbi:zinc finger protein ZFAT isoform X2 [Bufo gargarizans]|uniref:zinc finger protein ZFAT isoform X2 n=1 Tax=Bufo gargarizans TaxID=30331 RepID=UPI001CF16732|nr:zinc finger protein ZFAT isoform X2 [Bufo gargarizans]
MHSVENNCNHDVSRPSEGPSSIYMCKLCNLFSPSHSALLLHVTENHTKEGLSPEHIIIPLRPLVPSSRNAEELCVVKRKRGRPKGSTKKSVAEEEPTETNGSLPKEDNEEGRLSPEPVPDSLECRKCSRTFSNLRQLTKHICIIVLNDDEDVTQGNDFEGKFILPDNEKEKEKQPKRSRLQKTEKALQPKDAEKPQGVNPIVSVFLTAHEAIPGATRIVPIEAAAPAVEPEVNTQTADPEPGLRRGYQEYAIPQVPQEQAAHSSRTGPNQLKIFTCEYCNKVFKFKHSLQAHLRIHTNEKPYKCLLCNYASAIKANLSVHMRKHTGEKFSCDHCSFSCLSKGHLKVHVERVHKKIKQHCRFCKKKYSDVKNLIKHIKETHDALDKKVKDNLDELRLLTREGKRQLLYDCHICERKFKNELERDRHMLVHGDERPFACELCDHGATKYQSLELHVRKHPFVYVCSSCFKKFVSTVRLKAHIKEFHPDLQEDMIFRTSINQSFYLLEPGSDIQQEALGDVDGEAQLDYNAPSSIPIPPTSVQNIEQSQNSTTERVGLLPGQESQPLVSEQPSHLPDCTISKLAGSPDVSSEVSSEDLLRGLTEKDNNNFYANIGNNQGESNESGAVNHVTSESRPTAVDSSADQISYGHHENGSQQGPKDTTLETESVGLPPPAHPVPANSGETAAFMTILNGLHKRQLSVALFQKIRKIYGDLECEYCGKLFWYQVHYDMHVRTHTREHLYYCAQCSYSSVTKNCLKRHVIQKHSNMSMKCPAPGCSYSSPDKYKLQAHLKVHAELDKKTYSCPSCEKSFSDDRLIKSHIKANHPEVSASLISEVLGRKVQIKGLIGKRAAKCPYCDSYFLKNGSDLQRHIWAHEGVKPFKCTVCDYATRSKSNLKAHMNRHSTEKTHLCDMCGKKFKTKGTLKSHKLLHTADGKQFKCTICEFTAVQKPQLLRHMEQHTSFKPFGCALCHYSCNIPGSLKRHYNKKHPNEECVNSGAGEVSSEALVLQGGIKCPVCSFVYGTKWEFNRHLKSKHGLKLVENDKDAGWEQSDVTEEVSTQFLHITEAEADVQGTQTAVAALQDLRYTSETSEKLDPTAVNILQQIIELGTESHDAVASVVAMAPGTVTVVEQVTEEERSTNHAVMIQEALQQASVGLGEQHHLVVSSDDVEGIETVTVYTQGEETSEFIVYVQEAMQPVSDGTMEHILQEI